MSRFLIVGLPGAGKSTLAAKLGPPVVSLDEIRHRVSDGTPAGDYQARALFLRACQEQREAVFDFTGAGNHRHSVRLALSLVDEPLRTLFLRVPVDVAIARAAARGTTVPFPSYGVSPESAMLQMAGILEDDLATGYWTKYPRWTALALDATRPTADLAAKARQP